MAFIEGAAYLFVATVDAEGRPDCPFKGGMPGFMRVTARAIFPNCPGHTPRCR
jgi:hypothetical protein